MQNNPRIWEMGTKTAGADGLYKKYCPASEVADTGILYLNQVGLNRIWDEHEQTFQDMFNVEDKNSCAEYIKKYMGMGPQATIGYKLDKNRGGFIVKYIVTTAKCLDLVISTKGFIVTAVPSKYDDDADMDSWLCLDLLETVIPDCPTFDRFYILIVPQYF